MKKEMMLHKLYQLLEKKQIDELTYLLNVSDVIHGAFKHVEVTLQVEEANNNTKEEDDDTIMLDC